MQNISETVNKSKASCYTAQNKHVWIILADLILNSTKLSTIISVSSFTACFTCSIILSSSPYIITQSLGCVGGTGNTLRIKCSYYTLRVFLTGGGSCLVGIFITKNFYVAHISSSYTHHITYLVKRVLILVLKNMLSHNHFISTLCAQVKERNISWTPTWNDKKRSS